MTSNYTGVTYVENYPAKPWKAQVFVNGHCYGLGYFETEDEAARAYDNAAYHINIRKLSAKELQLNFPDEYSVEAPIKSHKTEDIIAKIISRDTLHRDREPTRQETITTLKHAVDLGLRARGQLAQFGVIYPAPTA